MVEVRLGESTNGADWNFRTFTLPYDQSLQFGGMIEEKFFFLGNDTENPKLLLLDELSDSAEIVDLGSYLPEGVIQKIDYGNERLVITTDTRIYSSIAKLSSENTSASSVPEDSPIGTEIGN